MTGTMRVLFIHRKGVLDFEGGEQDQLRFTLAALKKLGVDVDLADSVPADYHKYDLIHFFALDVCQIPEIKQAQGVPKVLTPVFWDRSQGFLVDDQIVEKPKPGSGLVRRLIYLSKRFSPSRNYRLANICRAQFHIVLGWYAQFQDVINDIDLFLPNSEAEMGALRTFYVLDDYKYRVVPNAVDLSVLDDTSDYAERNLALGRPFVLCSAGFDRRKNQYSLVRAMLDVDVPLVFAGSVREPGYFQAVKSLADQRKNVYFLGHLEKRDLYSVYKAASVHALPSFHDTPGIANLEAVAHRCVNVSTQIGGLREYLGKYSLYCNPYSVSHIREQVMKALDMTPDPDGAKLVRSSFTYEKAAQATLEAYSQLL